MVDNDTVAIIVKTPAGMHGCGSDKIIWSGTSNGKFSVASAYSILFNDHDCPHMSWNFIWKLPAPPNLKVFSWLLHNRKILTNVERRKRRLTNDDTCPVCNQQQESILHLLRDCPRALSIWKNIICTETIARTLTLDWPGWYEANIHCKVNCYGGMKWCSIFMFTCWQIWKWRNLAVFEEEMQLPFQPVKTIIDNATAWYHAQYDGKQKKGSKYISLKWTKPNAGWFKLNVDGARNVHNGRIGAGGVIRDYTGVWTEGFFAHIGVGEVIEAETWGLFLGLKMAVKLKIEKLEVECDSEHLVNMINQGVNDLHPLKTIINSCIQMRNFFAECKIMHIYREINKVADSLAKSSLDGDLGVHVLDQPPMHITQVLLDDLSDFPCFRNVP